MEYFADDFKIADWAIHYAEYWNTFCVHDETILITKGHIISSGSGIQYLAEPVIKNFKKFTSNSGWIENSGCWTTELMEAFSHYSYHISDGENLVCDLQGRYRDNRRYRSGKSRFELTDIAICSRARSFGPTDLGEKGIESFFANHQCNQFCHANGDQWEEPHYTRSWFPSNSSATSMFSSSDSHKLKSSNRTQFRLGGMGNIEEEDSDSDSDSW